MIVFTEAIKLKIMMMLLSELRKRRSYKANYGIFFFSYFAAKTYVSTPNETRGRTYVMITYVSKENNLGPDEKIRYVSGPKGPIFIL